MEKKKPLPTRAQQWREKRKKEIRRHILICIGIVATVVIAGVCLANACKSRKTIKSVSSPEESKYIEKQPDFSVQLLDPNPYSRPQTALKEVRGIVVHYTANPGTTARQNRDYFNGLAKSKKTYASSHFVIGLSGEIIQCIPCNEVAYASNDRNHDTIAIECCIADDTGRFNEKTYQSLIELTTWLMGRYHLSKDAVIRHYDITGKNCPKYFVEHPSAWDQFKKELVDYIDKNGVERLK